ncbi:hypothetical protein CRG98_031386 [Punica granatum]|uniref:Uncharacterized protein n=1 Tax=Punica granatum TaxID=22663 RepID=A0A2I0IW41_PUNGR|nr:hypothetical protein CRG98_031386 [Punica granatum]
MWFSSGPTCALLDSAAWECPPSWGCVTNTREKESPLPIYDLKVEGRKIRVREFTLRAGLYPARPFGTPAC